VLGSRPTLLALDMFGGHKTDEVLDTMRAHNITLSVIPGGCTSMVQPLNISINRPYKDILKVSINKALVRFCAKEVLIDRFTNSAL